MPVEFIAECLPAAAFGPDATPDRAWLWVFIGVLVAVAIFEVWAWKTKHQTISQGVQRSRPWLKWTLEIGLGLLLVHLVS